MERNHYAPLDVTRRHFFERIVDGVSGAALATLLNRDLYGATSLPDEAGLPAGHRRFYDLKPRAPHFEPKAKRVIHLSMNGGPSQMDLFDPKPALDQHNGEAYFDKVAGDVTSPAQAGGLLVNPLLEAGGNAPHDPQQEFVGRNILYVARSIDDLARETGRPHGDIVDVLNTARVTMFQARLKRPHPHLDDKILTAWNGLMIAAFARVARLTESAAYLE